MALASAGKRNKNRLDAQYDFTLGANDELASHAEDVVFQMGLKGYCVVKTAATGDLTKVPKEIKDLDLANRLEPTPETVIDGLLGEEGSVRHAELASTDETCATLTQLDNMLSDMARTISSSQGASALGFDLSARTLGIVHEAGMLVQDPPKLSQDIVMKWMPVFVWQRIMMVLFLGPGKGTLELKPFDDECNIMRLISEPGMLVFIRADQLWHKHAAPGGNAYALSCFLQQSGRVSGQNLITDIPKIPIAVELDEWAMDSLEELLDDEEEFDGLDSRWKYALEHHYHKGQQFAIRGVGTKQPTTWAPDAMWTSLTVGADVMTEVPFTRWDHNGYYDEDPNGWKSFKVNVRHSAFADGMELFDTKFFRISPAETKSMDPTQRQIMECGYVSLYAAGRTAKNLLQSLTSVYVGCPLSEWSMVDQGPEESGGCEQRAAGTGCAGSIMSNRFSFVFGMNGPSVTFDTDASSSLATIETGCIALDERKVNATMSMCMGIALTLTPLTWIHRVGLGQLSPLGRCFTFDQSATGWVKAEGMGALAIDNLTEKVEGVAVQDDSRYYLGTFGAVHINHSGQQSSMGTPHGPAIQLLISETCRQARITPSSVDAVETCGDAQMMNDAVEVVSTMKVCCGDSRPPLGLSSVKTNYANSIQGSGMIQVVKIMYNQAHGYQVSMNHLRCLSPQMDENIEGCIYMSNENMPYPTHTSLVGVTSIGWGGTMGYAVCSCGPDPNFYPPAREPIAFEPLVYWPGGGGGEWPMPKMAYYIVGSWNSWSEANPMEMENPGTWSFIVTLGANRYEEFCILIDGEMDLVLHGPVPSSPSGSTALGPDEEGFDCTWRIDGRMLIAEAPADPGSAKVQSSHGLGDKYKVTLSIAGKWRAVTWEKCEQADNEPQALISREPVLTGSYYLTGNFNLWTFTQMTPDGAPGVFSYDLRVMRTGETYFQIVRNQDRSQVFHPDFAGAIESNVAHGPDDVSTSLSWCINAEAGDVFQVQFTRNYEGGIDTKSASWRKVRTEPLSPAEKEASGRPSFTIVGSFTNWRREEMTWTGKDFEYTLQVGDEGNESFQILVDGDWGQQLFPNVPNASPHTPHAIYQGDYGDGYYWSIGTAEEELGSANIEYKVTLEVSLGFQPRGVTWRPLGKLAAQPKPIAIQNERSAETQE
mmetsp:Transcript_76043/g.154402  ORF Transcript_76043/g.154402 Transcript_76043/m.154402 type:complete len:1159 (-) Transcript_76043:168-3644(-)